MHTVEVSTIYNYRHEDYMAILFERPMDKVKLVCPDGEIITTYRHIAFCYPYMEFNREYDVPVSVKQFIGADVNPTNKVHMQLSSISLVHVYEYLNRKVPVAVIGQVEMLVRDLQINASIEHLEADAMSIDAEDYYQLHAHPEIADARKKMKEVCDATTLSSEKYQAIRECYDTFDDVVERNMDGEFRFNGLVGLIRCESTKSTQLHQGIVARGFESEINSNFYAEPVLNSFAEGLKSPYSFGAETRSGAKASMYTGDIMGDTEYLHRLVQMIAASFKDVYDMDCGSTVTYPFTVTPRYLPYIAGKYYMEDGVTKEVKKGDASLIGKTLNFRFPGGCAISDRTGCCVCCAGAVAKALPKGTNAGHTAATKYCGTGSQKVLSVKHDDLASLSSSMEVSPKFANYFKMSANGREITYTGSGDVRLGWKMNMFPNIRDIYSYVGDTSKMGIPDFSKLGVVSLFDLNGGFDTMDISDNVGTAGEIVHFSPEFLDFVRSNRDVVSQAQYSRTNMQFVNLSRLPKGTPIFIAPFQHFDMINQHKATKAFLHSPRKEDVVKLTDFNTFGEASKALLDLTIEKLGINLSVLELSIYAFTVSDLEARDFRPVRHSNYCNFLPMSELYAHRSIAAKIFSERQLELLKSPLAVTTNDRPEHPYDLMFL